MTLQFISNESGSINYLALSTDIALNKITGAVLVGRLVFLTDTGVTKVIKPDLTLGDYGASATITSSENVIGKVGGNATVVSVAPVLTVAATYISGDYVGTSSAPMTFSSCARIAGGTGLVTSCMLIDYGLQSVVGELWLFDGSVTAPADSAPWSLSDADMAKCIGIIPFTTYYASALNSVSFGVPSSSPIGFKCGDSLRELYGCFVTRGAPTYATGNLTFRLNVLQD
jgi:hypothetical protein